MSPDGSISSSLFAIVKRRGLCCRARDEKSTASFRYLKKFCEDCKSALWRARQFAGAELWNFAASRARELYRGSTLRSWRMIGRDGARRDFLEAGAREGRGCADKNIRRALRCARVDRIGLERRCLRPFCGLYRRGDELGHDPLPAIVPAHEKNRRSTRRADRPRAGTTTCGQATGVHRAA